jgi:hypothetical protein
MVALGLATALTLPGAGSGAAAPVVWVQAGHQFPMEPGYRAQTGAVAGPFGSEVAFTGRLAPRVVALLRLWGVDARTTPGRVTPHASRGATFISLHFGTPTDHAGVGHAIAGAGENWYHGEGFGTPSPRPYADSAPHRRATTVSPRVESASRALARRVADALGRIRTPAAGANAPWDGVLSRDGNVRMMRFYGYYRTAADARVLVECGAAGRDDGFLARTDLIARTLAGAIRDDLVARGLLVLEPPGGERRRPPEFGPGRR